MDLTHLRLVALGHSSAGRSSYPAAVHTRLAAGRKGFRPVTADAALAQQLTSTGALLGCGIYPPPSSRRTGLSAGPEFGRREVLGFDRTDYRGGALTGSAADDPETAQLVERLTHADAVLVLADTQRLATDPESQDEVRRTVVLLHRAVDEQPTPLPVVLVCTKADAEPARLGRPARRPARLLESERRGTVPPAAAPAPAAAR
ncbi:hypothetical protein ACFZCK_11560 [Kitasatospora purpeofusca]|uniref:TRAFAC clade GTPase domain-containing protein n=1 Tax=Kitasatospora purpeofusca TaxID=67352 RepID=UPI0036ED5D76